MKKNKTVKQWLNELPEPYNVMAISQAETKYLRLKRDCLFRAVYTFAIWADTQEGHDFWEAIANDAYNHDKL